MLAVDEDNLDCCACDEAKYDLEFIGLWSRDTHPKDYPSCMLFLLFSFLRKHHSAM